MELRVCVVSVFTLQICRFLKTRGKQKHNNFAPSPYPRREAFRDGVAWADLPELACEILPLAFVLIIERPVEADHSIIHKKCAGRNVGGASVSMALRKSEMAAFLQNKTP